MSGTLSMVFDHLRERPTRSLCTAAFGIAILGASAPTANAGLLDFLFAPSPPPASYAPASPAPTLLIHPRGRPKVKTHAARTPMSQPAAVGENDAAPCCVPDDGAVDFVLYDPTLRPGDAVMTKDGIRIFEGRISPHHAPADFVTVGMARNLVPKNRASLKQVDASAAEVLPLPTQASAEPRSEPAPVARAKTDAGRFALADR